MSEVRGDGFRLRRAVPADVPFLVELANHHDVEPYMGVRAARTPAELLATVEASAAAPGETGRFVVETDDDGWRPAGAVAFRATKPHHGIAEVFGFMLHPDRRIPGLADGVARAFARHLLLDLGFHRLELECYGFNERAIAHAERVYVREGVKRRAYRRHGDWVDAVLFALTREDLDERDV